MKRFLVEVPATLYVRKKFFVSAPDEFTKEQIEELTKEYGSNFLYGCVDGAEELTIEELSDEVRDVEWYEEEAYVEDVTETFRCSEPSDFSKVFGKEGSDWNSIHDLIAKIRDDHIEEITKHIPLSSAMSSPDCILYAIYKILEEKQNNT